MSHQYQWLNLAPHILEEFPIFLLIGNVWKSCLTGIDWYAGQSFVHNWGPATSAAFQGGRCPARISHLKWSPPRPLDVHKLGLAPSTFTTRTRTLCPGWQKGWLSNAGEWQIGEIIVREYLGVVEKKRKLQLWTGFWTVRNWKGKVIKVSIGSFIEIPQGDLAHQRKYKVFLPCQSRGKESLTIILFGCFSTTGILLALVTMSRDVPKSRWHFLWWIYAIHCMYIYMYIIYMNMIMYNALLYPILYQVR